MASGQTANYNLNQWEAGDHVLRTEFNEDNQKIDGAIAAVREECPMVKLLDVTTTEDAAQIDLDISGIDWEKYGEVIVYSRFKTNNTEKTCQTLVRLNGDDGASYGYYGVSGQRMNCLVAMGNVSTEWASLTMRIPYGSIGLGATCCFQDKSVSTPFYQVANYYVPEVPRSTLITLNFIGSYPLAAGCRFTVMGVKL